MNATCTFKQGYGNFLELTRAYSLPISVFTWFVAAVWGMFGGASILNVVLSFFAVVTLHLGTNLLDDYVDLWRELKKGIPLQDITFAGVEQKGRLIKNGTFSMECTFKIICALYLVAVLIGAYFTALWGAKVIAIALIAAVLCALYPFATRFALGEVIIAALFGPLLTCAVFFVLTGSVSPALQQLSYSLALFNVAVGHIHSLMDWEHDVARGKKTLCTVLKSKDNALKALVALLAFAYLNILILIINKTLSVTFVLTFLTLPMAFELVKSMGDYIKVKDVKLSPRWYFGPMENWECLCEANIHYFMYRFYLARNLAMLTALLAALSYYLTGGLSITLW